jgi:hypothetical protein
VGLTRGGVHWPEIVVQHLAVEEQQGAEGLILSGSGDMLLHCQVGEERFDSSFDAPLRRVQTLLLCSRILTRLASIKGPPLHRGAHPIPLKVPLPPRQAPRCIRRVTLVDPPKALCNSTYCTVPHVTLP